ncbi:MAG: agmatine deiminase family protein [Alphaproteobacteria bacterium]|nr:agmatine deiminase family protein [Alphaproteobacteria bacterium]
MHKTPAQLGFRMPAEWEKQSAIWLGWPRHRADWPGKFSPIPWVWAEIARVITMGERARILVRDAKEEESARLVLEQANVDMDRVDLYQVPTDRVWLRDSGPTFLVRGTGANRERMLLDWKFNAWAKYPNYKHDDKVPAAISKITKLKTVQPVFRKAEKDIRVVLEGGAIDVNGKGTILTTEECMLSPIQARNPQLTRDDMEQVFADYFGAPHTIWLGKGIVGDDTHGHVDDLARFTAPDTVVTIVERNRKDENYALLQDNLKRLKRARDQHGKPLTIAELPLPSPVIFEGERLPASYANFLITNKVVMVPTFNDANDRVAMNTLAQLFPKHDVIGIHAVDLVLGLGTLHCLSQQEPV